MGAEICAGKVVRTTKKNRYTCSDVLCPFYHCEDPRRIICEGVQENSAIHLTFPNAGDKANYKESHCQRNYESCLVEEALERKYADEV